MLPHNSYTTELTPVAALQKLFFAPDAEIDLAASINFWDFEGDLDEIQSAYDAYFLATKEGLSKIMGKPAFDGRPDTDEFADASLRMADVTDSVALAVWNYQGRQVYLRYSWDDKEIPILIALGIDGCEVTGEAYPGQF